MTVVHVVDDDESLRTALKCLLELPATSPDIRFGGRFSPRQIWEPARLRAFDVACGLKRFRPSGCAR